jgi:hypothetical protein
MSHFKTFVRQVALFLSLIGASSSAFAAYYSGGNLRPHGHTSNTDGGVLSNLSVSSVFSLGVAAYTTASPRLNFRFPLLGGGTPGVTWTMDIVGTPVEQASIVFVDADTGNYTQGLNLIYGSSNKLALTQQGSIFTRGAAFTSGIDAGVAAVWDAVDPGASGVAAGVLGDVESSGTASGSGHTIGVLGLNTVSSTGNRQTNYGVEGRVNSVSTGTAHVATGIVGIANWNSAASVGASGTFIGVQGRAELYNGDGVTPRSTGTAVGLYVGPVVGGAVKIAVYQPDTNATNFFFGPTTQSGAATFSGNVVVSTYSFVHAVKSGNQSLTSGIATSVTFSTEGKDSLNEWNGTTFTAVMAGNYFVSACIIWDNNATGNRLLYLGNNGTAPSGGAMNRVDPPNGTSDLSQCSSGVLYDLPAGGTFTIQAAQDSGGALNVMQTGTSVGGVSPQSSVIIKRVP